MSYRNYALFRKVDGKTKTTSFKQMYKFNNDGKFKYFCLQGKLLNPYVKIIPTPSDAKVTLTAENCVQKYNGIVVPKNTNVLYTIEKNGYISESGEIAVIDEDIIKHIKMYDTTYSIVKILTEQENVNIVLMADGYVQEDNMIVVKKGTEVSYTITCDGYATESGSIIATNDRENLNIQLTELVTITVEPIPSTSKVVLTYEA